MKPERSTVAKSESVVEQSKSILDDVLAETERREAELKAALLEQGRRMRASVEAGMQAALLHRSAPARYDTRMYDVFNGKWSPGPEMTMRTLPEPAPGSRTRIRCFACGLVSPDLSPACYAENKLVREVY